MPDGIRVSLLLMWLSGGLDARFVFSRRNDHGRPFMYRRRIHMTSTADLGRRPEQHDEAAQPYEGGDKGDPSFGHPLRPPLESVRAYYTL